MKTSNLTLIICGILAIAVARPVRATALLKPSNGDTQLLRVKSLSINSKITGAFARTTLTTVYKNPNSRNIEADFVYSAPKGAVVTGFAYWFGEEKVVARVVEKARAARIYQYVTMYRRDPALIEMVGKNAFRARIFPVAANQDLKIEIQLAQTLEATPNGMNWNYPLLEETQTNSLEKFALHLQSQGNSTSNLGTFSEGKLDVERDDFRATTDLNVQVAQNRAPLRASLLACRESADGDGFFALSLVSATPVISPRFKIDGISTYDVLVPKTKRLEAGEPFLVVGRYKTADKAIVALNNQSVTLDFGNTIEPNSVAASLWAQKRIEVLSEDDGNQFKVAALSKRFGLVSKWTSWLAIPTSERAQFQRIVDEADLQNAGRAYAQAVARADKSTAQTQKQLFTKLSDKLDREAKETGLQRWYKPTLASILNSELEKVYEVLNSSAQRQGKTPKQIAQLEGWATRLKQAGASASTYGLSYQDQQRVLNAITNPYLLEVESGRANSARATRLKARLALQARRFNNSADSIISFAAQQRSAQLAQILVKERSLGVIKPLREKELKTRITRVGMLSGTGRDADGFISRAQIEFLNNRTQKSSEQAAEAVSKGISVADALREFDEAWDNWEAKIGVSGVSKGAAQRRVLEAASLRIMRETEDGRGETPTNLQLARDIEKLDAQFSSDKVVWRIAGGWALRGFNLAEALLEEQTLNGVDSPRALKLREEFKYAAEKGKGTYYENNSVDDSLRTGAIRFSRRVNQTIAAEIARGREDTPKVRQLQAQVERLSTLVPDYNSGRSGWYRYEIEGLMLKAWKGRAHAASYQLLEAQDKAPAKVDELESELEKVAKPAQNTPEAFLKWEKVRRDSGQPMLTAEQYRLRPGDPLISVIAPQNSRQVIAILPSGEVKRLVWNAVNKAFEARFDVPAHATEGDYEVKILIVGAGNSRRQLTLHFAVDTSSPDGKGALRFENGMAKIRLETDENTDRVSAFLPWDERVELRRDESGIFSGELQVPAEWQNKEANVRFVLTDKAHNRSEISVSP